jgi:hypothetical protein
MILKLRSALLVPQYGRNILGLDLLNALIAKRARKPARCESGAPGQAIRVGKLDNRFAFVEAS